MKDRRCKIMYVSPDFLSYLLNRKFGEIIHLPLIEMPEDAVIVNVDYSIQHQAFAIIINHPSFEFIPYGDLLPNLIPESEPYIFAIKTKDYCPHCFEKLNLDSFKEIHDRCPHCNQQISFLKRCDGTDEFYSVTSMNPEMYARYMNR